MTQIDETRYDALLHEIQNADLQLNEALARTVELLAVSEAKVARLEAQETADHAALAALREDLAGVRKAMESRAAIEQAKGIIIAATGCTPDEAFAQLAQQSQHQNRKLRDVAEELVRSRQRSR